MTTENRQRQLFIATTLALGVLLCDRLFITPAARVWNERSTRIAQLKRSVSEGQDLIQRETSIRGRWKTMQDQALHREESAAENQMLKAFERWSQESRLTLSSIKPQWKRIDDTHHTLECRADASGSLSALTRFLYELEQDPLALRLDIAEIKSQDDNGEQLKLALQVSGLQLRLPQSP